MAADRDGEKYRGGMFDHVDVPALISLVLCAAGFILLILWLRPIAEAPRPETGDLQLDALSERMARILMPLKEPGEAPHLRSTPPPQPAAPPPAERTALARIEHSRQQVSRALRTLSQQVSHAAVLSILSAKGTGGRSRRHVAGGGLGFGDLDQKLGSLGGLTRYGDAGGRAPGARDGAAEAVDADTLLQKFSRARQSAAAHIGTFAFEKPQLVGGNTRQAAGQQLQTLSAALSHNQTAIRLLYEERLKINPALEGKVTVVIVIRNDGRVISARIVPEETSLADPQFQNEIIRSVLRWVFPPFTGAPVELKSPFVFKPV